MGLGVLVASVAVIAVVAGVSKWSTNIYRDAAQSIDRSTIQARLDVMHRQDHTPRPLEERREQERRLALNSPTQRGGPWQLKKQIDGARHQLERAHATMKLANGTTADNLADVDDRVQQAINTLKAAGLALQTSTQAAS